MLPLHLNRDICAFVFIKGDVQFGGSRTLNVLGLALEDFQRQGSVSVYSGRAMRRGHIEEERRSMYSLKIHNVCNGPGFVIVAESAGFDVCWSWTVLSWSGELSEVSVGPGTTALVVSALGDSTMTSRMIMFFYLGS